MNSINICDIEFETDNYKQIEKMYNINGHIYYYNNLLYFLCKYCNLSIDESRIDKKYICISDEEKIVKDLLE